MVDPPTDGQIEEGGTEGKERQVGRTVYMQIHAVLVCYRSEL